MSRDKNPGPNRVRSVVGVVALAAALLTAAGTASAAATQPAGPIVATTGGLVQGAATTTTDKFLGIPYASPPVGALRWRPPQPAARWQGVRQATAFAPHCAQPGADVGGDPSMSEDCLYLNVFTPRHATGRLPVMVWIHGGALVTGASDLYDPTNLVADNAVVVTINYRLGALGFLAHPALTDSSNDVGQNAAGQKGASGDFGLMDQQSALRWVQRNVDRFGGDAHDVTIFGESAGGLSVLSQLASPGAHGMFTKAIVESGSYNPVQTSLADAETAGEAFAAKAGCADQTAACLRGLPVATIIADQDSGYTPDIDGKVLVRPLATAFATGQFNRVPIVDGTNHDEWRLFVAVNTLEGNPVTSANYTEQIEGTLGVSAAQAAAVAAEYPLSAYPSPPIALGAVGTDAIFACNALNIDRSVSRFVPTYAYEFNDPNPPALVPPAGFPLGDFHASEILYVFNNPTTQGNLTAGQVGLAGTMQRYWTNFAARAVPTSFGTPFWPSFTSSGQRMQSLTEPTASPETDFATEHHCAFWAAAQA
jgi:para-nitrobenzyl esterase